MTQVSFRAVQRSEPWESPHSFWRTKYEETVLKGENYQLANHHDILVVVQEGDFISYFLERMH